MLCGEAPPPPDAFASDAATIASLPPLIYRAAPSGPGVGSTAGSMLVSSALAFVPVIGGFIAGAASNALNAARAAAQKQQQDEENAAFRRAISTGTLLRFAFYGEWLRVEHAGRDVTIVKPDAHQSIALNLADKTARIVDTSKIGETYVVDDEDRAPPKTIGEPVSEHLPDTTIAGVHVR